jgi:gamma-glutamylcyclotransferase (GGCT)/AIG2-like uncharacterized protein YtfP
MTGVVAVYGTLRRGGRLHHHLGVQAGRARPVGRALLVGDLYEVVPERRDTDVEMPYPCYYEGGDGRVVVELYDVVDQSLWTDLDELEGFLPHDLASSEYHRRLVALHAAATDDAHAGITAAWAYVYVRSPPDPARHIASGDWISATR